MLTQSDNMDATEPSDTKIESTDESESNQARAVDYINPLPMPLHEMICNTTRGSPRQDTKRKSTKRAISVSSTAHLAGR